MYTMKETESQAFPTMYFDAVIDANYVNLVLVLFCSESQKLYIPILTNSDVLSRLTLKRGLMYQRFHPPIIFADREVYIEATSFILPHDNALYI